MWFSVLTAAAAVLCSAGEVQAAAYTQWGYQLPTGGSPTKPGSYETRPKIWGYSTTGSLGNTVVNGTLNITKGPAEYYATAYIDTNISHDVTYRVVVGIYQAGVNLLNESLSQQVYSGGSGAYASVTRVGIDASIKMGRGTHKMESSLYGRFEGYTIAKY